MDFTISPEFASLRDRIAAFVDAHVLPLDARDALTGFFAAFMVAG